MGSTESKTDRPRGENKVYYIISCKQAVSAAASYKLTNIQEMLATFTVGILLMGPDLDGERPCLSTLIMESSIGENHKHHTDSKA